MSAPERAEVERLLDQYIGLRDALDEDYIATSVTQEIVDAARHALLDYLDQAVREAIQKCAAEATSDETIEALAEIEHERWAGWMRYQEVAPKDKRADWPRKASMAYQKMTGQEQESDRIEARKSAACIRDRILALNWGDITLECGARVKGNEPKQRTGYGSLGEPVGKQPKDPCHFPDCKCDELCPEDP